MNAHRLPSVAPIAILALLGCGRGGGAGDHGVASASPSASALALAAGSASAMSSAAPPSSGTAVTVLASAVPDAPPPGVVPPSAFTGARSDKACRAQTVELATYQTRGEVALAGQGESVAASWRVRLGGKREEQIAFASFDKEGRPLARPRGVGASAQDVPPRVFGAGSDWVVVWFDDKGLAYARPKSDPLPPPEVAHLGAVGAEVAGDVALGPWSAGGGVAAAPFGADKSQLGLFVFAPAEGPAVKAMGVTHFAKKPRGAAIAATAKGTFVAWDDGGVLMASRFDAAGREGASACTLAPANGAARERIALAATPGGAIAAWMEGTTVRTRALDASACPASPIWTAAEGKWATLVSFGESALLAWVASDGRLLAARLAPTGAPPAKGLDASEGTSGVKDPPGIVAFGSRAVFGWSEVMSPVISTKRLNLRVVDAACVP